LRRADLLWTTAQQAVECGPSGWAKKRRVGTRASEFLTASTRRVHGTIRQIRIIRSIGVVFVRLRLATLALAQDDLMTIPEFPEEPFYPPTSWSAEASFNAWDTNWTNADESNLPRRKKRASAPSGESSSDMRLF
jgi:hypothetical protein